jgi:AraC-like DNA-binding protein
MEEGRAARVVRSRVDGSLWEIATRRPWEPLRPYVRDLVGFEERSPRPRERRQFPGPSVVLIVALGTPLRVGLGPEGRASSHPRGGFAVGLGEDFGTTWHAGCQLGIQVDLTPTGARRLFERPLCELAGRVIPLRELLPQADEGWIDRLESEPDWSARLGEVERLLAGRLSRSRVDCARADWAVDRIRRAAGDVRIGGLARELGISPKHLIALFRDRVGVRPKQLARLERFSRVMQRLAGRGPAHFAELAREHGYFDQAHLAREVRRLTGLTPTAARASLLAGPFG